jgi:uncharacterized membrane protein YbhN (UPF0104 family)
MTQRKADRRRLLISLTAVILFVLCAWYVVDRFQWTRIRTVLQRTDFIRMVLLVWIAHFSYLWVRTCRWHLLVRQTNPDIAFSELYWITAITVSLAILTPAQLGEALKIELLKRRGLLDRLPGLGAYALERILDLIVIAGIGVLGTLFGATQYPGLRTGAVVLGAIALIAFMVCLRYKVGGGSVGWRAADQSDAVSRSIWPRAILYTIASWSLVAVAWQVVLNAVGVTLSFLDICWLMALITVASVLSLIPGGLGVADVLTAEALQQTGFDAVSAQAGAVILRLYALLVVVYGLAHLAVWSVYRLGSRTA